MCAQSQLGCGLVKPGSWIADAGNSYDRVADRYADLVRTGLEALPLEKRLVDHFAHTVVEAGGGPVLDVGCGPGWLTRDLSSRGLAVAGIDISTAMLRVARTNNPGLGFAAASLTQIPVADGATAGVFCWYVLHHVPDEDLQAAIRELVRVIVPGGSLMLGATSATAPTSRPRATAVSPCECSSRAAAPKPTRTYCAMPGWWSTPPSRSARTTRHPEPSGSRTNQSDVPAPPVTNNARICR
jgi:ubiquinone/menaquinone biosynthesis C-methylase UbiE